MKSEISRLHRAFKYAWEGVLFLFRNEPNARIHLALALAAAALAWWLGFSAIEWAILVITIGLVFAAEALNTAIEALTDLVSPDYHPQAKAAKDVAAAAVTIVAVAAVIMALFLYLPKIRALF
jgi:diacylglycerol kinase